MMRQLTARIYKSQQRGLTENDTHRLLSTFNFEGYQDETRTPFGKLLALNDVTLAPGVTLKKEDLKATLNIQAASPGVTRKSPLGVVYSTAPAKGIIRVNYSEYGGTQMQGTNYTDVHFLRGRQTTNSNGQVAFTSIFPGWYSGRATHIHVHIYNSSGTSLLITQIAFPEGTNSAVAQVNASTANGYTKGMSGYTYNANDNVFSDECRFPNSHYKR